MNTQQSIAFNSTVGPEPASEEPATTVICRPDKSNWGVVAFFAFFTLLLFSLLFIPRPQKPQSSWTPSDELTFLVIICMWAVPLFLLTACYALWITRAFVAGDSNGITWRSIWKVRVAGWDQVVDYYDQRFQKGAVRSKILTTSGNLYLLDCPHAQELRVMIEEKAVSAKTKSWQIGGLRREDDWPQVFRYPSGITEHIWLCGTIILIACLFAMLSGSLGRTAKPSVLHGILAGGLEGLWDILLALTPSLLIFPLALIPFSMWLTSKRAPNVTVTVDLNGIHYVDETTTVEAKWDEVLDYHRIPDRGFAMHKSYIVETKHGTFIYKGLLETKGRNRLGTIISHFATEATERDWRNSYETTESLTADSSAESGIHNYRTRHNRAVFWFPTVVCLSVPALSSLNLIAPQLFDRPVSPIAAALCPLAVVWIWWFYYRTSIRTTDEGIMQISGLSRKFIRWEDIQEVRAHNGTYTFIKVIGERRIIRFNRLISYSDELFETISKRAPASTVKPES